MKTKRCNGPLHKGESLPVDQFWTNKTGRRRGKPFSRCIDCLIYTRFGHTISGYVPLSRIRFIFLEIENRVGRAEAQKLMGTSQNFYKRLEKQHYVRKVTARRAFLVLRELRENNIVRHRDSINHGAKARGHKEREVTQRKHLYRPHGDTDAVNRRNHRNTPLDSTA